MNMIDVFMKNGDRFVITTEKDIMLKEGAPMPIVHKQSTYSVVCGDTLFNKVGEIQGTWWQMLFPKKIVKHRNNGTQYLLCSLDKDSGISGSSEFFSEQGEELDAKEIRKWVSKTPFDSDHMTIPLNSIIRVEPLSIASPEPQAPVSDGLPF